MLPTSKNVHSAPMIYIQIITFWSALWLKQVQKPHQIADYVKRVTN